jgi:hypothetical protein
MEQKLILNKIYPALGSSDPSKCDPVPETGTQNQ